MLYVWREELPLSAQPDEKFTALSADPANVLWLDMEASGAELRQRLESLKLLHPLTVERIFTEQPRAFLDEFDEYLHILLQQTFYEPGAEITMDVCHYIMGNNYLITIHTQPVAALEAMKLTTIPARFFSQGSDVLFYHLALPLINSGFTALDIVADVTEDIEDRIFPKPDRNLLNELFNLKRDLISIRKTLAPMREVFSLLSRRENPFVDAQALPFMSHIYDQIIRLHEISDTQREIVSGALEIYLSSMSNRMNEIMTTLTIVSTIILPLTLITGYYGMNLQLPESQWKYGFLYVLALFLLTVTGMLWYFKRRNWF
jgi:magnesium transporter